MHARGLETDRRVDLAGQHRFDGPADLAGLRGLGDEPLRPEAQRGGNGLRVVVRGHDDHGQLRMAATHVRERIEAVRARHVQVQQQQVGARVGFHADQQARDGVGLDEVDGRRRAGRPLP